MTCPFKNPEMAVKKSPICRLDSDIEDGSDVLGEILNVFVDAPS
jgi:hypothetical protein